MDNEYTHRTKNEQDNNPRQSVYRSSLIYIHVAKSIHNPFHGSRRYHESQNNGGIGESGIYSCQHHAASATPAIGVKKNGKKDLTSI
jgi:hypothetical protein